MMALDKLKETTRTAADKHTSSLGKKVFAKCIFKTQRFCVVQCAHELPQ